MVGKLVNVLSYTQIKFSVFCFQGSKFCTEAEEQNRMVAKNNLLVSPAGRLVVGWSPRAGCTVSTQMFLRSFGKWTEDDKHNNSSAFATHTLARKAKMPNPLDDALRIVVMRDPFARAVSSFNASDAFAGPQLMKMFGTCNITFHQWVEEFLPRKLHCDPHCSPQNVNPNEWDHIVPLENAEPVLKEISQKVREPMHAPLSLVGLTSLHHMTRDNVDHLFDGIVVSDMPLNDIKSLANGFPSASLFYKSKRASVAVKRIFRDDIAVYNSLHVR